MHGVGGRGLQTKQSPGNTQLIVDWDYILRWWTFVGQGLDLAHLNNRSVLSHKIKELAGLCPSEALSFSPHPGREALFQAWVLASAALLATFGVPGL